jgi:uncharacterized protein (TIGR03437 family)
MKRILFTLAACAVSAFAQSAETAVFVAALSPANEVPAITGYDASGTAVLYAHVMRNAQGQIVSGSVDFVIYHNFPDMPTVTGLHVHNGPAGVNAGVVINTGIAAGANSLTVATARGVIERQAQVLANNEAGVAALRGMFDNPAGYYANLHTTVYAGGILRGQLVRAERHIVMGRMLPTKEIPAINDFSATATGSVEIVRAYSNARYISGAATFSVDYTVPEATTFTGLHIHQGRATVNGPVLINTGIAAGANSVASAASGTGNITRRVEVPAGTPASLALDGVFDAAEEFYINLHSTRFPGGVVRSQLTRTETMIIPVSMSPANEVPAVTGLDATAVGNFIVNALRGPDGAIVAGVATFDLNHRFPAETRFTGLHIHDAKVGVNGGVTINSALAAFDSPTGFGNISRSVNVGGGQALTSLNSVVSAPENHYINLHTMVNAGGAVRAQLAAENTRAPQVSLVISAVSDINTRVIAPAGQFTIFGRDLLKLGANVGGMEGLRMPTAVNGTSVTIAGRAAPIVAMGNTGSSSVPDYIVALVPVDTPVGEQDVVVKTANGSSTAVKATVAAQAPALYFDGEGAIVVRADNLELVRPNAPARAGEALALLSTGLGQTMPALATGEIPIAPNVVGLGVTLTIGGQTATVAGSTVVPGLPGYYITLFQMPRNVPVGNAPVQLRINSVASNTVLMPVR